MNKKIKIIFSVMSLFLSLKLFAQANRDEEMQLQLKEFMKMREEMIKSFFDDSNFQDFDQQFENLAKKFNKDGFGAWPNIGAGEVVGEYDWRETPTHKILVLKVKQIKNKPLDIKIEKGQIKLKGDVESADLDNSKIKRISKVHFERIFSIPEGVDQNSPEFENKEGELLIKFKILRTGKTQKPQKSSRPSRPSNDQLIPIEKEADDQSI